MGWDDKEDSRVRPYDMYTKKVRVDGCNGTEQVGGDSSPEDEFLVIDNQLELSEDGSDEVDYYDVYFEDNEDYIDDDGALDKKKKKKKKEKMPMANATVIQLEVIFDDRSDGIKFGGWLIGIGRYK
eukprot:scaffold110965_cov33-Prasinocladus_malaysianus.AAC.1